MKKQRQLCTCRRNSGCGVCLSCNEMIEKGERFVMVTSMIRVHGDCIQAYNERARIMVEATK